MNWNFFGFLTSSKDKKNGADKSQDTSAEVIIGQLFENGPLIEVIEFSPIPLEEKKEKLMIEREKRLARKAQARKLSPKTT